MNFQSGQLQRSAGLTADLHHRLYLRASLHACITLSMLLGSVSPALAVTASSSEVKTRETPAAVEVMPTSSTKTSEETSPQIEQGRSTHTPWPRGAQPALPTFTLQEIEEQSASYSIDHATTSQQLARSALPVSADPHADGIPACRWQRLIPPHPARAFCWPSR